MDGVYIALALPEQDKVLYKASHSPTHTHTHTHSRQRIRLAWPKNYIQMKKKLEKAGYESGNWLCKHKLSSIRLLWSLHWNVVTVKVKLEWMKIEMKINLKQNIRKRWINTSFNGFPPPFFTSTDYMILIHVRFSFPPLSWFTFIFSLHFIWIVFPPAPAEDDCHPERAGDDECSSPKWLQSIVISGCRYFLRGAHQSFIIECQSGWDRVGRG